MSLSELLSAALKASFPGPDPLSAYQDALGAAIGASVESFVQAAVQPAIDTANEAKAIASAAGSGGGGASVKIDDPMEVSTKRNRINTTVRIPLIR